MTNFEHMTDEEKKLAIINGIYLTKNRDIKPCPNLHCGNCNCNGITCETLILACDREEYLNREYIKTKTENEKFCETLKAGEVIVVWNKGTLPVARVFHSYDDVSDSMRCVDEGLLVPTPNSRWIYYKYGRKLTVEERGE